MNTHGFRDVESIVTRFMKIQCVTERRSACLVLIDIQTGIWCLPTHVQVQRIKLKHLSAPPTFRLFSSETNHISLKSQSGPVSNFPLPFYAFLGYDASHPYTFRKVSGHQGCQIHTTGF